MSRKDRNSIKKDALYEKLRDDGLSKSKAAAIANAQAKGDEPMKKGGQAKPYEDWTKPELYERAQELEIEGRSGLTKPELINALRED